MDLKTAAMMINDHLLLGDFIQEAVDNHVSQNVQSILQRFRDSQQEHYVEARSVIENEILKRCQNKKISISEAISKIKKEAGLIV